jgi:CrcB protein
MAAISVGAMAGATARYKLSTWLPVRPGAFPWATFWTNVSGSFVLGVLLTLFVERFPPTRYLRPFATTGFLGGYTTFSTFSVEADLLVKDGHAALAAVYIVASLVVGIGSAWLGVLGTRGVLRSRKGRR